MLCVPNFILSKHKTNVFYFHETDLMTQNMSIPNADVFFLSGRLRRILVIQNYRFYFGKRLKYNDYWMCRNFQTLR